MASPNNFNFPYFPPPRHQPFQPPPPPYHPASPPPPHVHPPPPPDVHPPPAPVIPAPSSSNHTVIIFVFVSCGGLFLLAFLAVALFCFFKKTKKKTVQEKDNVHVDEHLKMKEAIVPGPHGPRAVFLEIEDDVHIDEEIVKTERIKQGSNVHSAEENPKALEAGAASSSSDHNHQLEQKA
ncbi:formin-like protein 2 [Durio zibethinus]|uniref:Formin-like protein 2 n=1 Tax=Durio zibethinus TaxID=66656 RepID=A0A6P5ZFU8_DURZI|nr:formin-like protein 2 [Durio zibethinus]